MDYSAQIHDLLEVKYRQYNHTNFIENDPISIPHLFTKKQDIEIMGFWAAILAWGQRKTIINKCHDLLHLMDSSPYDFIKNHTATDLKPFLNFKHRTFNSTDTLYFIDFFHRYYNENDSLETLFLPKPNEQNIEAALIRFHNTFFDIDYAPQRTKKHVSTPANKSACKRINMFLRWMVRHDNMGVDFGIWQGIKASQLICPCDLHVDRVARKFNLITRKQTDWLTAVELTENLKIYDATDPVKYDFALFGMGVSHEE